MLFPSHYSVPARARPSRSRSAAAGGRKGGKCFQSRPASAGQGAPDRHRTDIKKRRTLPDPPFQPTVPPCCRSPVRGNAAAPLKRDGPTHLPIRKSAPPPGTKKRRTHPAPPSPSTSSSSAAGIPSRSPAEDERVHRPTRKTAPSLQVQKSGGYVPPRRLRRPPPLPPPAYRPAPPAEDERFHLPTRKTAPSLQVQKSGGRIPPRRLCRPPPLPPPAYRPAAPPKTKGSTDRHGKPLRPSGYKKAADPKRVRRLGLIRLPTARRKPSATARLRGLPPECGHSTRR